MILTGGKRRKGANSGPGDGVSLIRHHTRETTMRAFVRSYIQAEKARREESGDKGFSLIELIVVVVILGVLAAVAIPVFLNVQQTARDSAAASAAANAASQISAAMAPDATVAPTAVDLTNLSADFDPVLVFNVAGTAGDLDSVCVKVTSGGGVSAAKLAGGAEEISSGPGC
jgi:type IV pilus assembly protein PilA